MKTTLIILSFFIAYNDVRAQPGTLDPTYGSSGNSPPDEVYESVNFAINMEADEDGGSDAKQGNSITPVEKKRSSLLI